MKIKIFLICKQTHEVRFMLKEFSPLGWAKLIGSTYLEKRWALYINILIREAVCTTKDMT